MNAKTVETKDGKIQSLKFPNITLVTKWYRNTVVHVKVYTDRNL